MFLARPEIEHCIETGEIKIVPFCRDLLKPASYVLRLGSRFAAWRASEKPIQPWSAEYDDDALDITTTSKPVFLPPGQFLLAATEEAIGLSSHIAGVLSTISHLARCGLSAVVTSSWISPGFGWKEPTRLTLELVNHNHRGISIEPGMPICHLACGYVQGIIDEEGLLRESPYTGFAAPSAPRLLQEFVSLKERNRL